jgi:hypothetical protein
VAWNVPPRDEAIILLTDLKNLRSNKRAPLAPTDASPDQPKPAAWWYNTSGQLWAQLCGCTAQNFAVVVFRQVADYDPES